MRSEIAIEGAKTIADAVLTPTGYLQNWWPFSSKMRVPLLLKSFRLFVAQISRFASLKAWASTRDLSVPPGNARPSWKQLIWGQRIDC
jgi:hypothetical protein